MSLYSTHCCLHLLQACRTEQLIAIHLRFSANTKTTINTVCFLPFPFASLSEASGCIPCWHPVLIQTQTSCAKSPRSIPFVSDRSWALRPQPPQATGWARNAMRPSMQSHGLQDASSWRTQILRTAKHPRHQLMHRAVILLADNSETPPPTKCSNMFERIYKTSFLHNLGVSFHHQSWLSNRTFLPHSTSPSLKATALRWPAFLLSGSNLRK